MLKYLSKRGNRTKMEEKMRVDMQIANHPCLLAGLLLTPLLCDQVLATREPKQARATNAFCYVQN